VVFDDTCTYTCASFADGTAHVEIPRVNAGTTAVPGWVTVTVLVTAGLPDVVVNVMVAVRDEVPVFAAADRVTDPLPFPVAGEIVAHD